MPPLHGLKVVNSEIHGYGLIALRPFHEGEIITYGDGILYTEDDDFDDTYALLLHYSEEESEPHMLYDLTDQTRWINHSCDPNAEVDTYWDPESKTALTWWRALREIEPGEELTYDYAFEAELAEPCACGTELCRGLIIDSRQLHRAPEQLKHLTGL